MKNHVVKPWRRFTIFHFTRPHVYSALSIRYAWATTLHYYLVLDEYGAWFRRKGSEIGWLWPWKRKLSKGNPWYETGIGSFPSLKEVDRFWQEYWEACKKKEVELLAAELPEPDDRMGLLR